MYYKTMAKCFVNGVNQKGNLYKTIVIMIEKLTDMAIVFKDQLLNFIPQFILSLLVLVIGYIMARLIKLMILRLVKYISRLINQRFENINLNQSGSFLGIAFFWIVMIFTVILISDILKLTFVAKGFETILRYSPNVLAAILTIFIGTILGKFIARTISEISKRVGFSNADILGKIAQYLILLTAFIIAIDQVGIEVTLIINMLNIILASLLFGAAIAFALGIKTSVSNIIATYYIRKLFNIGDHVKIGEIEGTIIKIEGTVVVLETEIGQYIIPAKEFNETKLLLLKKK